MTLPKVHVHHPALKRAKVRGRRNLSPFPCLTTGAGPHDWDHISSSLALMTGMHTLSYPHSQASRQGLNYTTGFPGSPAPRWQVRGRLCLHNCTLHEPIPHNICEEYKYTFLLLFLWRTLTIYPVSTTNWPVHAINHFF